MYVRPVVGDGTTTGSDWNRNRHYKTRDVLLQQWGHSKTGTHNDASSLMITVVLQKHILMEKP